LQYLCLIYHGTTGPHDASRPELDALLDELSLSGRLVQIWEPEQMDTVARLRVRAGLEHVETVSSSLAVCALLEARDLNDAIRLASRFPQARDGQIDVRAVGPSIKNVKCEHEHENSSTETLDQA